MRAFLGPAQSACSSNYCYAPIVLLPASHVSRESKWDLKRILVRSQEMSRPSYLTLGPGTIYLPLIGPATTCPSWGTDPHPWCTPTPFAHLLSPLVSRWLWPVWQTWMDSILLTQNSHLWSTAHTIGCHFTVVEPCSAVTNASVHQPNHN